MEIKKPVLWLVWLISTAVLIILIILTMVQTTENKSDGILTQVPEMMDKSLLMPGPLNRGHYQLASACNVCHTESFGSGELIQDACVQCHGDVRVKPFDSHPKEKFTDPRNADRLEKINAAVCITCHIEHKPEITLVSGVTQPIDFCFHCHEDIAEDRPSHEGMEFNTCKNSGCHNYHNNRALYTDFLTKHGDKPDLLEKRRLREKEFVSVLEEIVDYPHGEFPVQTLSLEDMIVPDQVQVSEEIKNDWLTTAHARSGVNCNACHMKKNPDGPLQWTDTPDQEQCRSCHNVEVDRFGKGKHGMREAAGLPPMTTAEAQIPMNNHDEPIAMTCNTCHGAHRYDVQEAAVETCLNCHNDQHSNAYKSSAHYKLWQQELSGELAKGSGVSCASCHMARINYDVSDWLSRTIVDHNQNANLKPNSKMIRSSCLHCHGLKFSIDALADKKLIDNNFQGQPSVHIESIDLAKKDLERALQESQGVE